MSAWTNIAKPSETIIGAVGGDGGEPIGMLMALTYPGTITTSVITGWGYIPKPST